MLRLKGSRLILTELAFISLGSNIEPELNLIAAAKALTSLGQPVAASNVYRNPAVGPTPQPDFLNAAVLVSTDEAPLDIRHHLRQMEAQLGRQRTDDKYAPRPIDLDLCLWGNRILSQAGLYLPDPDLLERPHLAVPMAELDPDFIHPITRTTLAAIAADLSPHADLHLLPHCSQRFQKAFLPHDQPDENR